MDHLRYLTDSYDAKIARIKEIDAPLNFLFITDEHNRLTALYTEPEGQPYELAVNTIDSLRYILERCPEIRFVVNGGDIGCDYNPDPQAVRESYREVMDALYRLPVPVHCCIGNHDDNLGIATASGWDTLKALIRPEEMHELCMKNNPTDKNYYYVDMDVDVEEVGWRFIFLNTSDLPYYIEDGMYKAGYTVGFSRDQVIWYENEALKTDRNIIVFSHIPLHWEGIFGTQGLPVGMKPFNELYNGPRMYFQTKACEQVKLLVAGHVHYDNLFYDDRLLSVTTLCSFAQHWAPTCPVRQFGTPTETAFDVFSIKENAVYITRFGAGEDRQGMLLRMNERPGKFFI